MTGWAVSRLVVTAVGGQGAEPGPGMPGAPARPPGWPRRGCRRPPRTARTARSHRPATRQPPPAGPVRSRLGGRPRPVPRTGTSSFAGRVRRARARTARVVPPGAGVGPAGPAPIQRVRSEAEEHLAGESVVPRMQWHELAHQLEDVYVVGEPVEQGPAGGHRILECGPLPGRHTTTVGQNHQSPGGLNSGCLPAASQCSAVTPPARHAERLPYGRATHVNRLCSAMAAPCALNVPAQIRSFWRGNLGRRLVSTIRADESAALSGW